MAYGNSAPLLSVHDLHAGYGYVDVLRGITLHAKEGHVITVIGPNGAGKSTLLNALMGILPSSGSIEYQGRPIVSLTLEERVMLGIALVPEKRELFGSMSVEDNLMLGAFRQLRLNNSEWRNEANNVYALFPRLRERRKQLAGTLSGGERQMLAIGRALMSKPKLLMLDEPSLGLAPLVVQEIFHTISELKSRGVTILLVEQNARAALEAAAFGYVLEMGHVSLEGPSNQLANDSRVINTYLGARLEWVDDEDA